MAEADESDGSFLMYSPDVAVVTNVDADHLDNYGTEEAYRASFDAFLGRVKPGGLLVTCADDAGTRDWPTRPARWGCGWSATASRPTRTTGSRRDDAGWTCTSGPAECGRGG